MTPNLSRSTFFGLLPVLAGCCAVAVMGAAGGRHWFTFGAVLLSGVAVLWVGFRWAIGGEGYWPRGAVGRGLYVAALVLLPLLVILLGQIFVGKLGDQRIWWWPPR